jgi:hypothetical protein
VLVRMLSRCVDVGVIVDMVRLVHMMFCVIVVPGFPVQLSVWIEGVGIEDQRYFVVDGFFVVHGYFVVDGFFVVHGYFVLHGYFVVRQHFVPDRIVVMQRHFGVHVSLMLHGFFTVQRHYVLLHRRWCRRHFRGRLGNCWRCSRHTGRLLGLGRGRGKWNARRVAGFKCLRWDDVISFGGQEFFPGTNFLARQLSS